MKNIRRIIGIILVMITSVTGVKASSSVTANFNGIPIAAGNKIWFTAVMKITGTATYPLTIYFRNQTITSPAFSLSVPDAALILDPSVTTATTVFNGTCWVTTAPPSEPGFYFLSGYSDSLTAALPGGLDPIEWSGNFTASRSGVSLLWHMGAAVYTSFNANLNNLGVKPSNCSSCSLYPNSHQGGTPENYLSYVIGGARGGGGDNYTGGFSGAGNENPPYGGMDAEVCVGTSITAHPVSTGSSWTSSNTSVATVSGGVVTGVTAGTARISYTLSGSSAWQVFNVTVNALPTVTAGAYPGSLCAGATLALNATGASSGGGSCGGALSFSWHGPAGFTSALQNPTRAGMTTAMAGVYSVTFTNTNGCSATGTTTVTVNSAPAAGTLSGSEIICTGSSTAFSSTVPGGTWSSSAPGIATVNASGTIMGIAAGSAVISYKVTNSCGMAIAVRSITVSNAPNAGTISGGSSVCAGATVGLTASVSGGVWSSAAPGVATVSASGVVTGSAAGTTTISYTVSGSCASVSATRVITVNAATSAGTLFGAASVCAGATTAFSSSVTGGAWSSAASSVATVSSTGVVSGMAAGTATISYTVSGVCGSASTTRSITVNTGSSAGTLTGTETICVGANVTYSSSVSGGVWSSTAPSIATVSASGVVTGVSAGTTLISYTVSGGCGSSTATRNVHVNAAASAGTISGAATICPGASATYTSSVSGGVWSSSAPAIASVSASGVVSGLTAGSATISYTVSGSCGSGVATHSVAVGGSASAGTISGAATVCAGATTAFASSVTGGAWSSSAASVATVNTSGLVSGVSAGIATISYTVTTGCGTATATQNINVNPAASAGTISGGGTLCPGGTTALTATPGGGSWSCGASPVASVSPAGVVTALTPGTATISYTVTGGCGTASASTNVTVNAASSAGTISGSATVCAGATTAFSSSVSGGVWSSSAPSVATVSTTGVVSGVSAGTATISYTVTGVCGAASATAVILVNPMPSAGTISGSSALCIGSLTALSNTVSGGAWSSSSSAIATISSMGLVTGIAAGTATMSYTVTNSCGTANATYDITVNPAADAGAITGTAFMCAGASMMLSDAVGGGAWTSGATGVATVNSAGVVTGVSAGTATISYTVSNSCGTASATRIVTINALPDAGTITGSGSLCAGQTTTLGDCTPGGAWSSGDVGVASINSSGVVTAIGAGTATVSYTVTNSCGTATATKVITVNAVPASLTGPSATTVGSTIDLIFTGGSWTSSNPSVATVDASGDVTGVSAGVAIISYAVSNACYSFVTTKVVTIGDITLAPITGTLAICTGATTVLSDATPGGTWSSSNTAVATIGATGIVTGISAGTATISYSLLGSVATTVVTVNAIPAAITGAGIICVGATDALSNAVAGGTWTSSTPAVALVDAASGIVVAVSAGTATIVYTLPGGCSTSATVNVIAVAPITGTMVVCAGSATALSDATPGGTWSSSATGVASVSTTGVVTGVSGGTANITYMLASGCYSIATVTVNAAPAAISGPAAICIGTTAAYTDATTGGTWSTASATITLSASGNATGITAGTATITYTTAAGCRTTRVITVNAAPAAIGGPSTLCVGSTVTLTDATTGGTWSSGDITVATISSTGVVSGVAAGTTVITYTAATGCVATATVTVLSALPAITGNTPICAGGTLALADGVSGGTWSSSNTAVATVGATSGIVTGVTGGTAGITYAIAGGCSTNTVVTVNAILPITGTASACAGNTTTLADATTGGTWSSSNTTVATVGSSDGIVTGIGGGTAVITYTIANGCTRTIVVTINAVPAIGGTLQVCVGATTALTDATTGGVWTSGNTATATIGGTNGVATGIAAGTSLITYTVGGCKATAVLTVVASPAIIAGTGTVCLGSSVVLTDATAGGTWSTANANIVLAPAGTSVTVTGAATGTGTVSYTVGTCFRTFSVLVNPLPVAIAGTFTVCPGATSMLSDATPGGTWTSSLPGIASIASSGMVTGVATGTTMITYRLGTTCQTIAVMTVIASPSTILGPLNVCTGSAISLSDTSGGGTWVSSSLGIATVGSGSGIVTGVAAGTVNISFTLTATGCKTKAVVTVTAIPNAGTLTGPTSVAVGATITLVSSGSAGGDWTSSSDLNATVGTTGIITGIAAGSATITYSVSNACGFSGAYKPISIAAGRAAAPTTGTPDKTGAATTGTKAATIPTLETSPTTAEQPGVVAPVLENLPINVHVIPNPNKGSFTIQGTTGTLANEVVDVEITNVLGQVIYRNKLLAQRGNIAEQVQLTGNPPNGTYLLNLKTKTSNIAFHFVISR